MSRLGRAQPKRAFITRGVVEVGEPIPQTIVKGTAGIPRQQQRPTPAVISRAPTEAAAGTVNLTPADMPLLGVALAPAPGAVSTDLTPAAVTFDGVALSPSGPGTVNLIPAVVNLEVVALSPVGHRGAQPAVHVVAHETAYRRRAEPVSLIVDLGPPLLVPPGTVDLTPADLPLTGVALSPTGHAGADAIVRLTAHETAYRA